MNDGGDQSEGRPAVQAKSVISILTTVMAPMFLAVVDQTIVAAALPAIVASLGNVDRVSFVVIAYLVATTVAAPIYGQLRDVYGTRNMMLAALALFVIASGLCAFAPTMNALVGARVLQGLGGGGLMTLSQALIGEAIPPRERARYQGYLASVMVTSSVFGPVAGGYLTEHLGWRSIFLINLPIAAIALALAFRLPGTSPRQSDWKLDTRGIVYYAIFIVSALVAMEQVRGINRIAVMVGLGLGAISVGFLLLLLRHEKAIAFPLFRLDLLRRPAIWRSDALAACHGAALVSLVTYLPVYFHLRYAASASTNGLLLLPLMIGIGFGSTITGRIVARTGQTMIVPSIGLVIVLVLLILMSVFAGRMGQTALVALLAVIGLFMGTVMGVVQLTVQRAAGHGLLGAAAASVQLSRSIGAAVGTALVGGALFGTLAMADPKVATQFTAALKNDYSIIGTMTAAEAALLRAEIAHAFSVAFLVIAAFVGVGVALAWSHPERQL